MNGHRLLRMAILSGLGLASLAGAHEGPPYPIVVDRATGAVLLSVWADPDVGTGTFHVYLEPLGDRALPAASEVEVHIRPVDGHLAGRAYGAEPLRIDDDRHHHFAEVEFDSTGPWTTRITVRGGGEEGVAETVVEVTPPGQGPVLDFVLYLFPFVAVGALVVRALIVGRRRPPPSSPAASVS